MSGTYTIAVEQHQYQNVSPYDLFTPVPVGATYELQLSVDGELITFDDILHGGGGNDRLDGGLGNDILDGGAGSDTADYAAALQTVTAILAAGTATGTDVGSDTLISIENVTGGSSADQLFGDSNDNVFTGNSGADLMFGERGHDTLTGGDGADTLVGNAGGADAFGIFAQESDILDGGVGNDTLYGEFTDIISGGAGTDFLYAINAFNWSIDLGATGIEWMFADFGDDTIDASTQTAGVEIYGSGGVDTITGSAQGDLLWAGVGDDVVAGGGGADMLFGDLGSDSLSAGDGDDRLYVDSTDTVIDGGTGFDAVYITSGPGMNIDFAATHLEWAADFAGGNDTLNGPGLVVRMEAYAGGGNDIITGGTGNDFLWGEAGDDTITGGGGDDVLVAGSGADILTGGAGNDTIALTSYVFGGDASVDTVIFDAAGWGTDILYNFEVGIDKLDLRGSGATLGTVTIAGIDGAITVAFGTDLIVLNLGLSDLFGTNDIIF